jgi:nucleotide-binding universal stress UspA family protein
MKKILVPCDFSEPAQQAYKFALTLAAASQAEVVVMKAIDLPIMYESTFGVQPYVVDAKLLKELEEDARRKYEKLMKMHAPQPNIRVSFHVAFGPVTLLVRQEIDEKNIDLVVMGTHGASGWKEYLIGSNAEKIVRFSPVPVMIIRKALDILSIKNIVFPTTLDMNQVAFVTEVKALQDFFGAALHVVYVNTPVDFRRDPEIKKELEEYAKHYKLNNYTLNVRSDAYEMDGIISFTHDTGADMIAMATHGRRGLLHLLAGSIAEDVVNHTDCPIWTCSLKGKK